MEVTLPGKPNRGPVVITAPGKERYTTRYFPVRERDVISKLLIISSISSNY